MPLNDSLIQKLNAEMLTGGSQSDERYGWNSAILHAISIVRNHMGDASTRKDEHCTETGGQTESVKGVTSPAAGLREPIFEIRTMGDASPGNDEAAQALKSSPATSREISVVDDLWDKLQKHCYDRYDTEFDASVLPANAFDEEVDNLLAIIIPYLRTTEPVSGGCIDCGHRFDGHFANCRWFERKSEQLVSIKDVAAKANDTCKSLDWFDIVRAVLDAARVKYAD